MGHSTEGVMGHSVEGVVGHSLEGVVWDIHWKVSWDIHWKVSCGTFTFQKCQKMTIGNLPPQKIQLAKNRCLQEGNGAENTKEKFQAVLYGYTHYTT